MELPNTIDLRNTAVRCIYIAEIRMRYIDRVRRFSFLWYVLDRTNISLLSDNVILPVFENKYTVVSIAANDTAVIRTTEKNLKNLFFLLRCNLFN